MVALWGSLAFQWFNSGVIGRLGSEEHVFFFSLPFLDYIKSQGYRSIIQVLYCKVP